MLLAALSSNNMFLQNWTKLKVSTAKPLVRNSHTACCIAGPLTGQQHPILMIVGGWYTDSSVLGDVWLLDVDKGVWSEVRGYFVSGCVTSNLQAGGQL